MSRIDRYGARAVRRAEAITTIAQVRHLQRRTRTFGLSFHVPLLIYGISGIVSAPLLAWAPRPVYWAWWIGVAVCAPAASYWWYRRRARTRGVGITPGRAGRLIVSGELLAAVIWIQPVHPVAINAPWLALAVVAVVAGRRWRTPKLYWVAGGVAALVVGAAAAGVAMPLTDACVGLWLCGGAAVLAHRRP